MDSGKFPEVSSLWYMQILDSDEDKRTCEHDISLVVLRKGVLDDPF